MYIFIYFAVMALVIIVAAWDAYRSYQEVTLGDIFKVFFMAIFWPLVLILFIAFLISEGDTIVIFKRKGNNKAKKYA